MDYQTGAVRPVGTFQCNTKGLQFQPDRMDYLVRHVNGRTYACSMDKAGSVLFLVTPSADGVPIFQPVAAWGVLNHLQYHGLHSDELPAPARQQHWPNQARVMCQWHDLNGDRVIQDDEWTFTPVDKTAVRAHWRNYLGNWVDDDLTFWTMSANRKVLALKVRMEGEGADLRPVPACAAVVHAPQPVHVNDILRGVLPDRDALYIATVTTVRPASMGFALQLRWTWRERQNLTMPAEPPMW